MKSINPPDKWLPLIGIPLFMLAQWVGNQYYKQPFTYELVKRNGLTFLLVLIQWQVIRLIRFYFRRKFPAYKQTFSRIFLTILTAGFIGMILETTIFHDPPLYRGFAPPVFGLLADHFGPMFFFSALVVGTYEVFYNFYELRRIEKEKDRIEKEKEQLQKAHLQSQLDSLKSQVNPHFLFNSLNSLLSLIPISTEKAELFVEELSAVYRYLLHTNEREITTLRQEIDFIHSYFHLLKTRYGEGIELHINITENLLDYQLPSLTLQLLLENAVKHNIISPDQPLLVEIFTTQEPEINKDSNLARLTVRNNLQRKIQRIASPQLGLTNILAKFKLLNQMELTISDSGGYFTVTMPLFKLTLR